MFDSTDPRPERPEPEQLREVDANAPLTAKLPAVVWMEVMAGIRELPWRVANPILKTLTQQFAAQTRPPPPPPEEDPHAPD